MLQEAIGAVHRGEILRARDLLTRLLKMDKAEPAYWLWMSAVVETPRERTYCLQEVLKYDPRNEMARRGLVLLGALSSDETQPLLTEAPRRNWQAQIMEQLGPQEKILPKKAVPRLVLGVGGVLIAIGLIVLAVIGTSGRNNFIALRPAATLGPTSTTLPTASPVVRSPTPTFVGPTPLWMLLDATYTPTPLYVNTPHPITEAYRAAIRRLQSGDLSGAITFLQQVLEVEKNAPDVYYYLGEAYRLQGNTSSALAQYNQALKLDPAFAPAYLGRAQARSVADPEDASIRQDLQTAIQQDPNLVEARLEMASLDIRQGDGQAALDDLEPVTALSPDSPLFYLYSAQANLLLGNNEMALAQAQKANELDKTMLEGYHTLAQALQANGQMSQSVDVLQTYTLYQPDDAQAWALLGAAYEATGQADAAMQAFDKSLSIDHNQIDAYLQRGQISLERGDGNAALDDFSAALSIDKQSFAASLGKGRALLALGFNGDAYIQFNGAEALAQTDQERASLYYWRAQSLEVLGQTSVAAKDWRALLDLPTQAIPAEWAQVAYDHLHPTATPTPTGAVTATAAPRSTATP